MPRYFFHVQDGRILLDANGVELRDIAAAQTEALRTSGDIIKGGPLATVDLWNGDRGGFG